MTHKYSSEKFFGKYRAIVKDNRDPLKLGRVVLHVAEVFGSLLTDWATPCQSGLGGFADGGSILIPPIGAGVWCEFEHGNVNLPVYVGSWWGTPNNVNEIPLRVQGKDDAIVNSKGKVKGTTLPFVNKNNEADFPSDVPKEVNEPSSPFQGKYPYVRATKTESGHLLEFDDTPSEERILLYHKQGSFIEFRKDGDLEIKSKKRYELIDGSNIVHVRNHKIDLIEDSHDVTVKKDYKSVHGGLSRSEYRADRKEVIRGKYDRFIQGNKIEEIQGKTEQNFYGPVTRIMASSLTEQIANQHERIILEKSSESIANVSAAEVAKALDILNGDKRVKIVVGNEKHLLDLGDAEWTLLFGSETHTLEKGNAKWILLQGNWDTIIEIGSESHTITTGNYNLAIETGDHTELIVTGDHTEEITTGDYSVDVETGDVSWTITTGSETHTIGVGSFVLGVMTGDIKMTTETGKVTIESTSGPSVDISAIAGKLALMSGTSTEVTAGTDVEVTAGTDISMTAGVSYTLDSLTATITAITTSIVGFVNLGSSIGIYSVPFAELMFSVFNSHTHISTAPGFPTGPPSATMIPFVHSSILVKLGG